MAIGWTGKGKRVWSGLASSPPRRSAMLLPPNLCNFLIRTPYRALWVFFLLFVTISGGIGVVIRPGYLPLFLASSILIVAVVSWLRGEVLLNAWNDTWEELERYRSVLHGLTRRYAGSVKVSETIVIRYYIGENGDEDRVHEIRETQVGEPDRSLMWRTVRYSLMPHAPQTFQEQGFDIQDETTTTGGETIIEFLPLKEAGEFEGMVIFSPEIGDATRKWNFRYRASGTWDPLRKKPYRDGFSQTFDLEALRVEVFEVRFILPPGRKGRFTHTPKGTKVETTVEDARNALVWRVEDPQRALYELEIEMDPPKEMPY
jgi:hypothetical protein